LPPGSCRGDDIAVQNTDAIVAVASRHSSANAAHQPASNWLLEGNRVLPLGRVSRGDKNFIRQSLLPGLPRPNPSAQRYSKENL